ncbi:DEAD/DEAH box helicase [Glutamicibacter arilaitensis]|uniref:DEAD/DEAH box helicase n=1 Tax=Glutamicibacter arilaitensis TaxID=256701 RepID=UPI003FD5DF08
MITPNFVYDQSSIQDIAARFGLRDHNVAALENLIQVLAGDFEASVPQVMNMATGSGKTYLMAAFIEYLREAGLRNVMVITPSLVVQSKTIQNFTFGATRYISGADQTPSVITPDDYTEWTHTDHSDDFFSRSGQGMQLFVFNIQQLLAPPTLDGTTTGHATQDGQRRTRKQTETHGSLYEYLASSEDLVVIADEHHLYGPTAKAFRQAIKDLSPSAVVGLTASASDDDHVIFSYPLHKAISDGHVKQPVIAFRGNIEDKVSEEQQLRDALTLLKGKQKAFDKYVESIPGTKPLNAVMFVICPDVANATETAELLRTSEYFGHADKVLQVDNQHNDVTTLSRLDALDHPGSPVRAVVSVNKLREGWDVKNIAVMVARRTMASEVLTQQTMGRGLRLPFGKLTKISTIDQLDIIAHQSFNKLLKSEDILKAFGLQDAATRPTEKPTQKGSTTTPPTSGSDNSEGTSEGSTRDPHDGVSGGISTTTPGTSTEWDVGGVPVVIIDGDAEVEADEGPELVKVQINEKFAGTIFFFPSTTMTLKDSPFSLVDIDQSNIETAAKRISDSGSVMEREEIVVSKSLRGRLGLSTKATEQAHVDGIPVDEERVATALLHTVFASSLVERNQENIDQASRRIIPALMQAAPIKRWTDVAAESAAIALRNLVTDATITHTKSLKSEVILHPRKLPVSETYYLAMGEKIHERISERKDFDKGRYYGEWDKGLFDSAKFDSYSAEYKLAELLNKSADIQWWKRLYDRDQAKIAFRINRTYRPDFIVKDTNDVYWILEGKATSGRTDEEVQDKRKAAEKLVYSLISKSEFRNDQWGYLVAYEDTIKQVRSWAQLRDSSDSVTIPPPSK